MGWSRIAGIVRKLRLIATSDLTNFDKLRYVAHAARQGSGLLTYRLRGGESVALRQGTTDSKVFDEIFLERAYGSCIAALPETLGPIALIDLGANIGLSTLFLARVLKVREIIAVEPDPDNFALLSENLRTSGLENRSTAVRAFAGAEHAFAELLDSGNGAWGMRIGALSDIGTPVLPLARIAQSAKSGAPVLVKCDIEGGERELFRHMSDWEHLIHHIVLELHTEFLPVDELLACLAASRFQWAVHHGNPLAGASIVLLLLERLP
jgi:FkbM family methyltransferase